MRCPYSHHFREVTADLSSRTLASHLVIWGGVEYLTCSRFQQRMVSSVDNSWTDEVCSKELVSSCGRIGAGVLTSMMFREQSNAQTAHRDRFH